MAAAETTKQRIMEKAHILFLTRGYDNTSIQMIIDELDIAKGTFYHHFTSKAELLSEIAFERGRILVDMTKNIVDNPEKTAVQKFMELFNTLGALKVQHMPHMKDMARMLYDDRNILLREKMMERSQELVMPFMIRILEQGEQEGSFNISDIKLTARMIFLFISAMGKEVVQPFIHYLENPDDVEAFRELKDIGDGINSMIERILGTEAGTLHIYDFDLIFQHHNGGKHDTAGESLQDLSGR